LNINHEETKSLLIIKRIIKYNYIKRWAVLSSCGCHTKPKS